MRRILAVFSLLGVGCSSEPEQDTEFISSIALRERAPADGSRFLLLDPAVTRNVMEQLAQLATKERDAAVDVISGREREVLALVAEGLTNREIAARLIISDNTVRNHISHIMDKLDMTRRAQAAAYAARRGLVNPDIGTGTGSP